MNGWHRCHLCDCEFYDPGISMEQNDEFWIEPIADEQVK